MLKIYRCINSSGISQRFGENKACGQKQPDGSIKVIGKSQSGICPIGYEDLYVDILKMLGHNGNDRPCWYSEPGYFPVEADWNGEEVQWWMKTEVDSNGGIGVDIVSHIPCLPCTEKIGTLCPPGTIHYVKWRSWHHLKVVGWDGKPIKFGDLILYGDSTGISGGNHVHESPKWCDKDGRGIHGDNGYHGAFSGVDHYVERFVLDVVKERAEADIRLAIEARQKEDAARMKAELEKKIRESQLPLLQLMYKLVFLLQQQLQAIARGLGSWLGGMKGR